MAVVQVNKRFKRKLTDREYTILISEVRTRPCLWDDCHADFKKSAITRKLWDEIGLSLNFPGDEARKKWKNLKDTFRKYLQKLATKSSASTPLEGCKWKFFTQMLFVKDVVSPNCLIGDLIQQANDDDAISNDDEGSGPYEYESPQDVKPLISPSLSSTPAVSKDVLSRPRRPNANYKNDFEEKMMDLEQRKTEALLSTQQRSDNEDDDYHFLVSLLPFIRELGPIQKLQLRTKIQSCVTEAYVNYKTPQDAARSQ